MDVSCLKTLLIIYDAVESSSYSEDAATSVAYFLIIISFDSLWLFNEEIMMNIFFFPSPLPGSMRQAIWVEIEMCVHYIAANSSRDVEENIAPGKPLTPWKKALAIHVAVNRYCMRQHRLKKKSYELFQSMSENQTRWDQDTNSSMVISHAVCEGVYDMLLILISNLLYVCYDASFWAYVSSLF